MGESERERERDGDRTGTTKPPIGTHHGSRCSVPARAAVDVPTALAASSRPNDTYSTEPGGCLSSQAKMGLLVIVFSGDDELAVLSSGPTGNIGTLLSHCRSMFNPLGSRSSAVLTSSASAREKAAMRVRMMVEHASPPSASAR